MERGTAKDKSFRQPEAHSTASWASYEGGQGSGNVPFIDFMLLLLWLSDGCDEAFEVGVVDTVDMGELGLMMSLIGVVFPPWFFISSFTLLLLLLLLLLWCSEEELEWFVTFCWAIRSCFRNLARRFWNHTWGRGWEEEEEDIVCLRISGWWCISRGSEINCTLTRECCA